MTTPESSTCRLCGSATSLLFRLWVLGEHHVGYHQCQGCGSLQTDAPTWLDRAYAATPPFDAPTIARASFMQSQVLLLFKLFPALRGKRTLDVGGGSGMLSALLVESGVDAYHSDPLAINTFAPKVAAQLEPGYGLITCIEVWEHFAQPAQEIDRLFVSSPEVMLVGTNLWREQGAQWPYLYAAAGQHVFFYSPRAMRQLAEQHGYDVFVGHNTTLFTRAKLSRSQRFALRYLSLPLTKLHQALLVLTPRHPPE